MSESPPIEIERPSSGLPVAEALSPGRETVLGDEPVVSIVVPTLNEENYIAGLIQSLADQTYGGRFEVIIADGGSTDRTRAIVEEKSREYSWLRLIDNPGRTQSRGFNRGMREARGEVIGYVGAHSELAPDYIEQTVKALHDSGAVAVGGRWDVVADDGRTEAIALAMNSPFGVGTADYRHRQTPTYTDTVLFGSYLRGPLEQAGGIDESLDVNEDYELNYRLRKQGHRLYFSPAIRIKYFSRSSLSRLWRQYRAYGFWKARVLRLHPSSVRLRHLLAPAFVAGLAAGVPLALLWRPAAWIYVGAVGIYLGTSLLVSVRLAVRHGWRHLPHLPLAFAALHLAWGAGFHAGIWRWWVRSRG